MSNNGTVVLDAHNATCDHAGLTLAKAPDADIAGIGVILAFLLPAYISFFLVNVGYFTGLIADDLLTTADKQFFRVKSRAQAHNTWKWRRWAKGLEEGILSFADQQIVFGIAILATGFVKISYISIYHWQTVTYLAWMSSNVHLTTLTVLRHYFEENKVLRTIRITGMMILFVLLFAALVPATSTKCKQILLGRLVKDGASYGFNAPARCFFSANQGLAGPVDPDAPWAFIILIISYVWKIGVLFKKSRLNLLRFLRAKPLFLLERALIRVNASIARSQAKRKSIFTQRTYHHTLVTLYATYVAFSDFAESFAASLYFLALSLTWGSVQLLVPRQAFNGSSNYDSEENQWGFGQILPMMLLILPFMAIVEHFYGHTKEDSKPITQYPDPSEEDDDDKEDDYFAHVTQVGSHETGAHSVLPMSDTKTNKNPASPITPATIASLASPNFARGGGAGDDDDSAALMASTSDQPQLSSTSSSLSDFFTRPALSAKEREALHMAFYRSRLFTVVMAWLNLGTVAFAAELVYFVFVGQMSSGMLWLVAIPIIVGIPLLSFIILFVGGMGSRLFALHRGGGGATTGA